MSLATIVLIAATKGSLLLGAAWLAMHALPRLSAAVRHLIWASALGGMILMPVLVGVVPPIPLRFMPAMPVVAAIQTTLIDPSPSGSPIASSGTSVAVSDVATTPGAVVATVSPRRRSFDSRAAWPLLWIAVGALLLLRIAFGRARLAFLVRRASIVDDGEWLLLVQRLSQRLEISRPVTLLRSSRSCVPMTWGLVYPTILLPAEADAWPLERRTIVLLHELAHVSRLDAFTQFVAQVATAVFWFNPFAWLAARSMRIERELACDDCVIASGARPSDYAHDLLQIARSFSRSSDVGVAALAMARRGDLEERLMAILDPAANRSAVSRGRAFIAAAGIVAVALPLAAFSPRLVEAAVPAARAEAAPGIPIVKMVDAPVPQHEARRTPQPVARQATAPRAPDRETLLSVARAAAKLTSSYDKAELLVPIAKYYTSDAELSAAYLAAAVTISTDYDCSRTLLAFLAVSPISDDAIELAMTSVATKFTSDYEKASVILAVSTKSRMIGPEARSSMIRAIATIRGDYDRRRAMSELIKDGRFNDRDATDLIQVASGIKGSYDKAEALIEIAQQYQDMRGTVRKAYLDATETITSAADYRRAVEALVKRP